MKKTFLAAAAAAAILLPTALAAQTQGRMHGKILDPEGNPLAGVQIDVLDPARTDGGHVLQSAKSNKKGNYTLVVVDATRNYTLRFQLEGYHQLEAPAEFGVGANEEVDWTLQPIETTYTKPDGSEMNREAAETFNEGVTAFQAGDRETAKAKFEAALAIDENIADAWAVLAAMEQDAGDSAAALEKADKALALNAEQALALDMRYQALRALDREEEADAARELLVAASPKSGAVALLRDGVAQFQAGETEAAITLLEQSLVADPELYHSHFNLGMAYANLDERAKAAEQFQAFLDKAPADDSNRESAQEMIDALQAMSAAE